MIQETINLLGLRATDKVTGFTGVISSVSFDLYGCVVVVISPPAQKGESKLEEGRWFDVQRLALSGKRVMDVPKFKEVERVKPVETRARRYSHGAAEKPMGRHI